MSPPEFQELRERFLNRVYNKLVESESSSAVRQNLRHHGLGALTHIKKVGTHA